jgi:hypothetical protein
MYDSYDYLYVYLLKLAREDTPCIPQCRWNLADSYRPTILHIGAADGGEAPPQLAGRYLYILLHCWAPASQVSSSTLT